MTHSNENSKLNNGCVNKTIFEDLYEKRCEQSLQKALQRDKKYREANDEACRKVKEIDELNLDKEEWRIIDAALSAVNKQSAEYGRVVYQQGFHDAISLLKGE